MKKLTLLLLLMISTNVMAEWTVGDTSSDGTQTVYLDIDTIKRKENKVSMWIMIDYKTVQEGGFLSAVTRYEYDCEENTSRMLDFIWYKGNMMSKDVLYGDSNMKQESRSISPNSMDETILKIACGKK